MQDRFFVRCGEFFVLQEFIEFLDTRISGHLVREIGRVEERLVPQLFDRVGKCWLVPFATDENPICIDLALEVVAHPFSYLRTKHVIITQLVFHMGCV